MISLYQFLIERKNYTEAEAQETIFRYENGMTVTLPEEVRQDIRDYNNPKNLTH